MVSQSFPAVFALSCLLVTIQGSVHAQSAGGTAAAQQPGYTFQAGTRIVLTDVTVTDKKGNPVHGLRASDFHIFDNNKPQVLASFEEHATAPVAPFPQTSTAPGVYSNSFLLHLPPVLNIIVIDIDNLEIVDQMYLNYELSRFVKNLPPASLSPSTGIPDPPAFCFRASHQTMLCCWPLFAKPSRISRPLAANTTLTFRLCIRSLSTWDNSRDAKTSSGFREAPRFFCAVTPRSSKTGISSRHVYDELEPAASQSIPSMPAASP